MKEKLKRQNGITLIALVITIIVLLILAGVSIAMLTGENGILKRANEAVDITKYKTAEEKVNLAIIGAMADDGEMTVAELKTEVGYQGGSVTGDAFPVQVQMDGHTFTVDANGTVTSNGSGGDQPSEQGTLGTVTGTETTNTTVQDSLGNKVVVPAGFGDQPSEQGTLGTVTGTETTNTTVQDSLGNKVVVPAGFKVQNPDKTVPDGIIIEDVSHKATEGSEFVWIPVGQVNREKGEPVTIKLSRYTFDDAGKETDKGEDTVENFYKELPEPRAMTGYEEYIYTTAKDINAFKASAVENSGYYVGRYEARTTTKRPEGGEALTQLTEKPGDYVYSWVTQPQAAQLSRGMYSDNNFTSDLVNSYAWDTAIKFLQEFDNRKNKTKPYSQQKSINTSLLENGTTADVICNVYDMASNTMEWTTETSFALYNPSVKRGSCVGYDETLVSSSRYYTDPGYDDGRFSFRPILYL